MLKVFVRHTLGGVILCWMWCFRRSCAARCPVMPRICARGNNAKSQDVRGEKISAPACMKIHQAFALAPVSIPK